MQPNVPKWRAVSDRVHSVALGLSAVTLLCIAVIVLAGVVARLLFDQPIPGSNELIGSCLMIALVYPALSSTQHIRITLFTKRMPKKVREGVEIVVLVLCTVTLLFGAYAALGVAIESFVTDETTLGLWTFDIYPFRFIILIGLLLMAMRIVERGRSWLRESDVESEVEAAERAAAEMHIADSAASKEGDR